MLSTDSEKGNMGIKLVASITDREVKQRVYTIISSLTADYWLLRNDLTPYAEASQLESNWFDLISFLNWYAHNFNPRNYIEVGVRRGRSIAQVLVESPETKAYGFDIWIENYAGVDNPGPEFVVSELKKLGVNNQPTLIRGNSHETLPSFFANPENPQEFDLINIDGDHSYSGAKMDLDIAFAHLAPGGAVVFDDIRHHAHPELGGLWNEYKSKYKDYLFIEDSYGTGTGVAFKPPFTKLSELNDFNHEKSEQRLVKKIVKPGMVVFDIGANVGDYSSLLSKLVGESGKVYAFEPTSSIFQKLQARLTKSNYNNTYIFKKAVYSEDTRIELHEFPDEYSAWNSIGKPKMQNPQRKTEYVPIVKTELVEAIALDSFCKEREIEKIDYLKLDVEGAESDALKGMVELLREKAIGFIQFEISQKMLEGLNRTAKETFDILIEHGYECHRIEGDGEIGEKVIDSYSFYENYIAFRELPIHFFTIVLNGEPFIRYHIEVFKQLPCKWHWHIVEGVADLKHDTAWSLKLGGEISDDIHRNGRSNDGTTKYLDELAQLYPDNVTIYRQPEGVFWDGKREMTNAPLANIREDCLLWQVDVDELWTVEQLCIAQKMFILHPEKTAAFFWCWYFVGENLVISTRNCYAENPQYEWLRVWRFKPGYFWAAHEPPILVEPLTDGEFRNVAAINHFRHEETEKQGLVFQHFAYVMQNQLQFKERYYGYKNALSHWQALQSQTEYPVKLREYLPWVGDETMVDTTQSCGVVPIARKDLQSNSWRFVQPGEENEKQSPILIVDGVFFQQYNTGIARVWRSLLEEWAANGFAKHIVVLDRAGTAPKVPGIWYRDVPAYDEGRTEADREMLQQVCDAEGAELFISTYYTTPLSTPSVLMVHDMIPEVMGWDLNKPMWREKHRAIAQASAYIAVSENTARDLVKVFPQISPESVTVAHNGVKKTFIPASPAEVNSLRTKYGIGKPYFLVVGVGNYKNTILFLQAFAQLHSKTGFEIVFTAQGSLLQDELRTYTSGCVVHILRLSDRELAAAYGGAVALVYPSKYEGFGLPVLEALRCGCPVITCRNASIPEVAGEAAIYVSDSDANDLANALCDVQKPEIRRSLIAAGLEQAKKFSWSKTAQTVSDVLIEATLVRLNLREINLIIFPDWSQSEENLGTSLSAVIEAIASHPDKGRMTLLICTEGMLPEDANLFISGVAMNLLLQSDLDVTEGPEISIIGQLPEIQWQAMIDRIHAIVRLENENKDAISDAVLAKIITVTVGELSKLSFVD